MHWNVDPIIFSIGGFGLRYYPLMFILGISLGYMYVRKRLEKNGMTKEHAESMQNYIIAGMIIGARLGHCLFYDPEYYLSNPLEILQVWKGGLASHGGFVGVLIAIYLFSKKWKEKPYFWFIESILPVTVMTAGFIRLGNSSTHGAHQDPQKFTSRVLPSMSVRRRSTPSGSVNFRPGRDFAVSSTTHFESVP